MIVDVFLAMQSFRIKGILGVDFFDYKVFNLVCFVQAKMSPAPVSPAKLPDKKQGALDSR